MKHRTCWKTMRNDKRRLCFQLIAGRTLADIVDLTNGCQPVEQREKPQIAPALAPERARMAFSYSFFYFGRTKAWEVNKNEPLVSSPAVYH